MYVTDTHGLIWFLTEDRKLGKKAEEIFLSADRGDATVVIPSIVLLEILHICEKQNAKLKFKQIFDMVQNARLITKDKEIIKSGLVEVVW